MARVIGIENDVNKDVRTVTLRVADKNVPGRTQILRHPITKIVLLVPSEKFDSPTEGAQTIGQDEGHLGGAK